MYIYIYKICIHTCVYVSYAIRIHIPAAEVLSVRFPKEYDHINLAAKHPKLCTYFNQNSVHIHTFIHTCMYTHTLLLIVGFFERHSFDIQYSGVYL